MGSVEETVAEMQLGDSFYLIEILGPDGGLRYSLEYQGPCDGPCIDRYIQSLQEYAAQEGCVDCSHISPFKLSFRERYFAEGVLSATASEPVCRVT